MESTENEQHNDADFHGDLDYWSFVALATSRLNDELDAVHTDASHLALSFNRASEIMKHIAESQVHRPLKLTWSSFRMLFVLWNVGEIEQSKLTLLTNSSKATVSNLSAGLLKQGFIERLLSHQDRRTYRLRLTPAGEETVRQAYLEQNELLRQWISPLNESERDTLNELLNKLMDRKDIFGLRGTA
ncbi:MarR family winged helix-turn-helix transcriptional regulator [Corynebacterium sp. A21]|uniref:MarR family winged helix-turn-helix transcriptional regulator n=1 Tax=Corynebacterium sp. A21 TaxID=3457318 RepID=UPI003FD1FDAE